MRQYVWTPLQGVLPNEDNKGAELRNMNNYEINLEGSGDFKEDAILDFVHDVSNMIGGCNTSSRGDHFRFGFYQKKVTKPLKKTLKPNQIWFKLIGFGSVILEQKLVQISLAWFFSLTRFFPVWLCFFSLT